MIEKLDRKTEVVLRPRNCTEVALLMFRKIKNFKFVVLCLICLCCAGLLLGNRARMDREEGGDGT